MIAMAVIQMAEIAATMWVLEIHKRSGPFTYRISSSASTAMLKRLLPKRFPTAMSIAPILTAATETATSGSEVDDLRKRGRKGYQNVPDKGLTEAGQLSDLFSKVR